MMYAWLYLKFSFEIFWLYLKFSFEMFCSGKLLGSFLGKCSGSIRSIARHPELPVVASCGE